MSVSVGKRLLAVGVLVSAIVVGGCDPDAPVGLERRDCVVILGDSIFALTGAESDFLQDLTGQQYREFFQNGAQLVGGFVPDIRSQLETAIRGGDIRTIIMDGGGNDSLIGGLSGPALVQELQMGFMNIFARARSVGVENIIVQGYYRVAVAPPDFAETMTLLAQSLEAWGDAAGMNVVTIDPSVDPFFATRNPSQYTIDGIHPTDPASLRLAELVFDAMVANNIERGPACPMN